MKTVYAPSFKVPVRDRFLRHNPHTVPVNQLIDWIKLFVFIDDTDSLQQLVDKICSSSSGVKGNELAKKLLKVKEILTVCRVQTFLKLFIDLK